MGWLPCVYNNRVFWGVLPLVIKWSVATGFHNQFLPVHYTRRLLSGREQKLVSVSLGWLKTLQRFPWWKKKRLPYSLMSFWCGLSQRHSVGAKLLIEFDGTSAALWNDMRCHGLFPRALISVPRLVCPPLYSLCVIYHSVKTWKHMIWWITKQKITQTNLTQTCTVGHLQLVIEKMWC